MQSSEYPDLRWMPPKSWTDANRTAVQLVVIHTTEGSARASAAEDGASYDQRRADGTSTHYFHDSDSTIQCVHTADQAHTARTQGNRRGIHHELCTRAGSATWGDAYHQAMLRLAATQAARDANKWDIPVRKLSPVQVADGMKGFCGHADITNAFPQDNGTHTDPGKNFPWSQFLDMVRAEMSGSDDMAEADIVQIVDERLDKVLRGIGILVRTDGGLPAHSAGDIVRRWDAAGNEVPLTDPNPYMSIAYTLGYLGRVLAAVRNGVAALQADNGVDEQEIAALVLAGLNPAAIAAAIPGDIAAQVAAELSARLSS